MSFLSRIFGLDVYRLRKKYDRVREHADRENNKKIKLTVLQLLDQIESTLVLLEEQNISSHFERRRLIFQVKEGIEKARMVLKQGKKQKKAEEYSQQQSYQNERMA